MSIIFCIIALAAEALCLWALLDAEGLSKRPNPPVRLGQTCRDEADSREWEA